MNGSVPTDAPCEQSTSEHFQEVEALEMNVLHPPRPIHRRMHSDGSARLSSFSVALSNSKSDDESEAAKLCMAKSFSGVRRRKFQEFCMFGDSSHSTSCSRIDQKPSSSTRSNRSTFTHRRCASHTGDYFTSAAHELGEAAISAVEQAEELVLHLWKQGWKVVHHRSLPLWLRDNDFLLRGHRPQLASFRECFRSIFRLHTETGNIWTHLIGELTVAFRLDFESCSK